MHQLQLQQMRISYIEETERGCPRMEAASLFFNLFLI